MLLIQDHSEKTERPTNKRLEDARLEGRVALSQDLVGSCVLSAGFGLLLLFSGTIVSTVFHFTRSSLGNLASTHLDAVSASAVIQGAVEKVFALSLPILLLLFAIAAVMTWLQVGFRIRLQEIAPDLNRIEPLRQIRSIVGLDGLGRIVSAVFKVVAVSIVLVPGVWNLLTTWGARSGGEALHGESIAAVGVELLSLILQACGVLLIISAFDWGYRRWNYKRSLMMTRTEVQDEKKEMYGDPHIRRRRRSQHSRLAKSNQVEAVDAVTQRAGSGRNPR